MKEMAQRKKEGAMDNQVWQSVLELRNLYEKDNNQTPLQFNPVRIQFSSSFDICMRVCVL